MTNSAWYRESRCYRRIDCSVCKHIHLTRGKWCESCKAERGWEIIDEEGLTRLAELKLTEGEKNYYGTCGDTPPETRPAHGDLIQPPDTWPRTAHYNRGTIEAIAVIEDWKLNFNLGNAIKYIARVQDGVDGIVDLRKAQTYLDREIYSRAVDDARGTR